MQLRTFKTFWLASSLLALALSACASASKTQGEVMTVCLPSPGSTIWGCRLPGGKTSRKSHFDMKGFVAVPLEELLMLGRACSK